MFEGLERPLNAILGFSSHDYFSVLWYDSVSYCGFGITGNLWSFCRVPPIQCSNWNAFATRDAEEEYVRALRGHFMPHFGTGRPFGRRMFFPFHGPDYQPPKAPAILDERECSRSALRSPHRGCKGANDHPIHPVRIRDNSCEALNRRPQRLRYAGAELVPPTSVGVASRYCCE